MYYYYYMTVLVLYAYTIASLWVSMNLSIETLIHHLNKCMDGGTDRPRCGQPMNCLAEP